MEILVIGGSGSTGVDLVRGLHAREHCVTTLSRGVHEVPGLPSGIERIKADPHFAETLTEAIAGRTFDLVYAMYGRVKVIAEVFAGRAGHLVSVGGVPSYRGCIAPDRAKPYGMPVNAREDAPLADEADPASVPSASRAIIAAERAVFAGHAAGAFGATHIRFPQIYGPRSLVPWEWSVVKRIIDGRRQMILPDDGLGIISRCAARNAAEVLLKVSDHLDIANGQAYNVADDDQFTLRQWAELICDVLGAEIEFVGIPTAIAPSALIEILPPGGRPHILLDASKVKRDLGYVEVISAHEATRIAVEWLVEHPVQPKEHPTYAAKFDYDLDDRLISAYRAAVNWITEQALDEAPEVAHPMAHPKVPSLSRDERGR
jgi:nucleoside-diphosphate-sugar epimerase